MLSRGARGCVAAAVCAWAMAETPPPPPPAPRWSPGTIQVFAEETEPGGVERAGRRGELARLPNLLILRSAVFDPVRQGEPDYSPLLPSRARRRPGDADSHHIVQFRGRIHPHERAFLEAAGARVLQYLPHNAYLVRAAAEALERAAAQPFVRWHGAFLPGYRVSPLLARLAMQRAREAGGAAEGAVEITALLFPGEEAAAVAAEIEAQGFPVKRVAPAPLDAVIDLQVPRAWLRQALYDLSAVEAIAWLEPSRAARPTNDHSIWVGQSYDTSNGPLEAGSLEYSLSAPIWKRDLLGGGQILGVADSGVDRDACQFADPAAGITPAQAVPVPDPLVVWPRRKLIAYNVLPGAQAGDEAACPARTFFHGTHVSGAAAGDSFAHAATPTQAQHDPGDGMAPRASLIVEDVGTPDSCFFIALPPRLYDLWAQERGAGASISSNSWGVACEDPPCGEYTIDAKSTDRFVWENPDFTIFFSAGNDATAIADGSTTAAYKNAVTVGATSSGTALDRANSLATFSSRGPTSDGRIKPDLGAPGASISSAAGNADPPSSAFPTCGVVLGSGTSMACPTAAGLAVLARQYFMEGFYPSGSRKPEHIFVPSAALLKAALVNGARNMTGANVGGDAPNFDQGWGRLHLDDVLYFNDSFGVDPRKTRLWDVPHARGLATGEVDEVRVRAAGDLPLKVTLVWSDPPAAPNAGLALVNDLDLEVIGPSGTYRGNQWSDPTPTAADNNKQSTLNPAGRDALNNLEGVRLAAPSAGLYRIRVLAEHVPGAGAPAAAPGDPTLVRQGYALVVTGSLDLTAGSVSFDERQYPCGSASAGVQVFDDTAAPSPVSLASSATGDAEVVSVAGSQPAFSARLPLEFNAAAVPGDGRLQVGDASTITATYVDAFATVASASIGSCAPPVALFDSAVSGGCDGDAYLDDHETVALSLTLRNQGVAPLTGVSGTLTTETPGVVIGDDSVGFSDAAPGALSSSSLPFDVSALAVAAGAEAMFRLALTADGFPRPAHITFTRLLEQDAVRIDHRTVRFNMESGAGSDVSPPCAADSNVRWTTFGSSSDPLLQPAILSRCDPLAPSPARVLAFSSTSYSICGSIPSSCSDHPDEKITNVLSPWISTVPPASTFVSATLERLSYRVRLRLPLDSASQDVLFGSLIDSAGREAVIAGLTARQDSPLNTDTWQSVSVDLMREDLEELQDPSRVSIRLGLDARDGAAASTSTGLARIDDVELTFSSEGRVPDARACALPCSAPPPPTALTATNPAGRVHLEWTYSAGVGEYHLYRGTAGCGGPLQKIAEIPGTWLTADDRTAMPGVAYSYVLRAADGSGACESSGGACTSLTPMSGSCVEPPRFSGVRAVSSNDTSACGVSVFFDAGQSVCGGGVTYDVHRSTTAQFAPSPGNLLASGVAGSPYVDTRVESGKTYCYAVRARDGFGNADSNSAVLCALTSGPRVATIFADNAEVDGVFELEAPWSRSNSLNHNSGGQWSYRSAQLSEYPPNSCGAAVSPELLLMPSGTSRLSFWTRYNVEHQWDGMVVEVATAAGGFTDWTPLSAALFYPSDFSQTAQCPGNPLCPGQTYCNACCYPPLQGAFNGPADNLGLTAWASSQIDISAYNGRRIRLRFNFSSDPGAEYEGITVDEITVSNVAQATACSPGACPNGPAFYGLVAARDADPLADSGVRLDWVLPSGWGSGGAGQIVIYRDGRSIDVVAPEVATYVDAGGEDGRAHSYQVVAVNSCGARDGNSISRIASDCAVSPMSVDAATLRAEPAGGGVRLSWTAIPGAGAWRLHWLAAPALGAACGSGSVWSGEAVDASVPTQSLALPSLPGNLIFFNLSATSGPACPEVRGSACP